MPLHVRILPLAEQVPDTKYPDEVLFDLVFTFDSGERVRSAASSGRALGGGRVSSLYANLTVDEAREIHEKLGDALSALSFPLCSTPLAENELENGGDHDGDGD